MSGDQASTDPVPLRRPAAAPVRPEPGTHRRRVRVWFGDHVVADYQAEAELADRYAAAMSRRFAGLRVTSEPISPSEASPGRKLPGERLWEVAPK